MAPRHRESPPPAAAPDASPPTGERRVLDEAFAAAYDELRRLAGSIRRHERAQTLNPTALVNEAWLKLAGHPSVADTSPLHFKRIAARAMRQVLVEAARRRHARKRGGAEVVHVTFEESRVPAATWGDDVLGLDEALEELAQLEPRQAQVVEYRFFGGLDVAETAAALEISESTVIRDWRAASAWLALALRRAR